MELDPHFVSFNFMRQEIHLANNGRIVTVKMSEFVALAASVLSQAEPVVVVFKEVPKEKPKKTRVRK